MPKALMTHNILRYYRTVFLYPPSVLQPISPDRMIGVSIFQNADVRQALGWLLVGPRLPCDTVAAPASLSMMVRHFVSPSDLHARRRLLPRSKTPWSFSWFSNTT